MIVYSVIGFPMGGGWATFHKEYKRRKNAEKQQALQTMKWPVY